MSKVLVTGGAGFIGSHLVDALLNNGYAVRVLDNLIYGQREWVDQRAEFINADICDLEACQHASKDVVGIFHLAAMSRAGPSLENINTCTQSNVIGTQNILLAARTNKVSKLIYSGSSTYYGNRPSPQKEYETPCDLLNFYAVTKFVGEQYVSMFDKLYDLKTITLRYFNVYGPRQPQAGAYALVLGIFLKNWSEGKDLVIHGDGSQRRDFIHVHDVVRANIMSFESDIRDQIFNVGSGNNVSIKELADMISRHQIYENRRAGDADVTLADIGHIQAQLGWSPDISFEEGLQDMMKRIRAGE